MINQKPANKSETKQPLHVEAAVATATGAVEGGVFGFALNVSYKHLFLPHNSLNPKIQYLLDRLIGGSSLIMARDFAVFDGLHHGITCVIKRLRGKEDIQTSLAAGFGSGVMTSLVSGTKGTPRLISVGVFSALIDGGFFKLGEKLEACLEKILEKESLTIIKQSALQDENIPARVDHIQREKVKNEDLKVKE